MIKMELFRKSIPSRGVLFLFALVLAGLFPTQAVPAESESGQKAASPDALSGDFKSAIVIDAATGLVLVAANENSLRQPASMLKMMTELIVLEHIAEGELNLADKIKVSAKASKMGGSQVYLKHGEIFTVEELLQALAIHSANDAAVVLAEHVAGSTNAFIDLMNMRAQELGMTNSVFHTVHGLPPEWRQEPDLTTARDLAVLGRELAQYPQALLWASTKTAPFRDGKFLLTNPNKLVGNYRGLDGLKTGYTGLAGFCVTATAIQKGKRLISVVMGCSTDKARATETTRLLTHGFNMYKQVPVIAAAGQELPDLVTVKGGKKKKAIVAYGESLTVSVPKNREADLVLENEISQPVTAPLTLGQEVGRAVVLLDGVELGSVPIVTMEEIAKGNWLNRLLN